MIKKLKICGFDFDIEYSDEVIEDGQKCLGCCKSDSNLIQMKKGITPQRENEVLIHEAIHAISDIMNLDLTENTVNSLGVTLTQFIKSNKQLVNKILKEN